MREYTDPSVIDGIRNGADWADPTADPTLIDWPARQAAAAVFFHIIDSRPVNPAAPTGIERGRNELGHWGEMQCADALVFATDDTGARRLLMIERGDGHGWAIPGGKLDQGETALAGAVRELHEETGLSLPAAAWRLLPARVVPDPRASDEAWMVTTPAVTTLDASAGLPAVAGADDAKRAAWINATTYEDVVTCLATLYDGGQVFRAHRQLLQEALS